MEIIDRLQSHSDVSSEGGVVHTDESLGDSRKPPSILEWYGILRTHYHWPVFQVIRFALWLAR